MKRIILWSIAALFTFLAGISVTTGWILYRAENTEHPPCRSCAETYSLASEIPTVSVCEIVNNPEPYANRIVRIQAKFVHDAGYISLRDNAQPCGQSSSLRAGLAVDELQSCEGTGKALVIHSGFGNWYDGGANITFVGRYGRIEDNRGFDHGERGVNILCLEEVSPLGSGSYGRIRYTIGKLFRLSD
jgi:hypothetical protein